MIYWINHHWLTNWKGLSGSPVALNNLDRECLIFHIRSYLADIIVINKSKLLQIIIKLLLLHLVLKMSHTFVSY